MWLTQLPHEDYEEYGYSSLDVCPDGSIIVAGWYDNITSIEYNAGVLLKLDTNGIMEWITSFGGPTMNFYQVRALSGGSYIVVGDAAYDAYSGSRNLTLVEFNSAGSVSWNMSYPISANHYEIKPVSDGFIVAVSPSDSTPGMGAPFIIKFDLSGNMQWNKTSWIPGSSYVYLTFAPEGYILYGYVSGYQMVAKLNNDLGLVWQKYYSGTDMGGIIAGALSDGRIWATYQDLEYVSSANDNSTTMMLLDTNGNSLWNATTLWGVRMSLLAQPQQTSDGGYLIGGQFIANTVSNVTGFITKLDSTGHLAWTKLIDIPGYSSSVIKAVPVSDGYIGIGNVADYALARHSIYAAKLASAEGQATKQNATLTLQSSRTSATNSESFTLSGSLSAARSGNVALQWSINGSGFIYSRNETLTNGQYSTSFGPSPPGTWAFKVVWAGDADYNPAESNTVSVTVTQPAAQTATVTFSVQGIGDFTGNILAVDGSNYAVSQLPKAFTWEVGSSHYFEWLSPVASSTANYTWSSTSGLSTSRWQNLVVAAVGGSVIATYSGPPAKSGCFIATATYGSASAPQVQALRDFRDGIAMKTFAGSNFMQGFLTWYYSWSPPVADSIAPSDTARGVMRVALQPLLNILQVATVAFSALSFNPEFAIVSAGFIAAALIGLIYFLPVATVSLLGLRRLRKGTTLPHASRALSLASIPWLASLALIVVAELLMAPGLMVLATLAFVALTVIMVAGTASLWLVGLKLER